MNASGSSCITLTRLYSASFGTGTERVPSARRPTMAPSVCAAASGSSGSAEREGGTTKGREVLPSDR